MPGNMSISVNGQSKIPPGFRFHPTEEELLLYYLRKKVSYEEIDLDVIRDVDLNKLEPWDIQEVCRIGTTPQNDWYFFSHKDKKYPTGTRTNRATAAGFWKATGRDKVIYSNRRRIGMRKTLVFYKGRAPHGLKSDWIMHEYRLDDNISDSNIPNATGEATQEVVWVVCRTFKKKDHQKTLDSPTCSSMTAEARTRMFDSSNAMEEILEHMGDTSKEENEVKSSIGFLHIRDTGMKIGYHETFLKLPSLESPNSTVNRNSYQPINPDMIAEDEHLVTNRVYATDPNSVYQMDSSSVALTSWAAFDRLAASQLNGQTEASRQLAGFIDPTMAYCTDHDLEFPTLPPSSSSNRSYHPTHDFNSEINLWSFAQSSSSFSSSDPLCHLPTADCPRITE